ncbi:DUF2607 family protein [Agarivorans sp. Alg241-V36]|uniref:DUF2607 family protein n=1 Tax=Agarivorans sp. Alg241-V36 TaxID=2305992 RepID=UPI0013D0BFA0|nr:DUF2607 family protein [Agarivorans sp. Alg241-V36]
MILQTWQKRLTWLLILSVSLFVLAWAEHQVERLDPEHSELHCQLCFNLEKLATAIVSSVALIVLLKRSQVFVRTVYLYTSQHAPAASARSPPLISC